MFGQLLPNLTSRDGQNDRRGIPLVAILGEEDFLKLFGSPRSELAGFIDKDAFLQAHEKRKEQLQVEQP